MRANGDTTIIDQARTAGRHVAAVRPYHDQRTGSGLGLAIAKNIIEGMGGSIALRSQPNQGTEIRIDLPDRGAHDTGYVARR